MLPSPPFRWLIATLTVGIAIGWWTATLKRPPVAAFATGALVSPHNPSSNSSVIETQSDRKQLSGPETEVALQSVQSADFAAAARSALALDDSNDSWLNLRALIRRLPVDQLSVAAEQAKKLPRNDRWQVLTVIGRRWAELDPQGAAAFGLVSGRTSGYNNFLHAVVEKWSSGPWRDAEAWLNTVPPGEERSELIRTLVTSVARNDPQAALQLLQRQPGSRNQSIVQNLFIDWAGRSPQAAAAAALNFNGTFRNDALNGVAESWAGENPQAALSWTDSIGDLATRKNLITRIANQWAEVDPLAVIAWARGTRDEVTRQNAFCASISVLAVQDSATALSQIEALPAGDDRDQIVIAAAQALTRTDARSAVPLLDQLPPGPQRNEALMRLCRVWGEAEPRAALDYLFANATLSKEDKFTPILRAWMGTAPEEAVAWANALPAGDKRDSALAALVGGLAETDFARAQTVFGQLSEEAQGVAASSLAYSLIRQDIHKAATWAVSLPSGKAQNAALGNVAAQWALQNPNAAAEWLNELTPGVGRDRAISDFSHALLNRDPEDALAWAVTIGDVKERSNTIATLAQTWLYLDGAKARKWLADTSQLTPDEKQHILAR